MSKDQKEAVAQSWCPAGLKYVLMLCQAPCHYATCTAVAAATIGLQHAWQWPIKLSPHLQPYLRIAEVAHVGVVLKLTNDICHGMGLNFWSTCLGESTCLDEQAALLFQTVSWLAFFGNSNSLTMECDAWLKLHLAWTAMYTKFVRRLRFGMIWHFVWVLS